MTNGCDDVLFCGESVCIVYSLPRKFCVNCATLYDYEMPGICNRTSRYTT